MRCSGWPGLDCTRRAVLGMTTAAAVMPGAASGAVMNGSASLFVRDLRFEAPAPHAASSATVEIADGDVTRLWTGLLDARWRKPGFILAGRTGADILFVLERLAWDRGRRVVHRRELVPPRPGDPPLILWMIAPAHPAMVA